MVDDSLTLADLVLAVRVSFITQLGKHDLEATFPNLVKGLTEIQKLSEWKPIEKRMLDYVDTIKSKKNLEKNRQNIDATLGN